MINSCESFNCFFKSFFACISKTEWLIFHAVDQLEHEASQKETLTLSKVISDCKLKGLVELVVWVRDYVKVLHAQEGL